MKIKPINSWYEYEQVKLFLDHSSKKNNKTSEEENTYQVYKVLLENFERRGKINLNEVVLEPLIDQVYDKISEVSNKEKGGIVEKGLKLGEEYGELSAEILKFVGYKRNTTKIEDIRSNILLESTDCLIMIFEIMNYMGYSKEKICNMAYSQIKKWQTSLENNT